MYKFDAVKAKNDCIQWIRDWFEMNGNDCNAIIAISGGADSSIVAALCVEALGKDRVFGILMPDGEQKDIQDAKDLVNHLGINYSILDIHDVVSSIIGMAAFSKSIFTGELNITEQCKTNIAPRIRMAIVRAISQNMNGRYINTCNFSENYIGFFTVDGDGTGDCSPLGNLTKTEVKEIGRLLLPPRFVDKPPADGLTGKTDEDNFGFTYDVLDKYIRTGEIEDMKIKAKIDAKHKANLFKLEPMAMFEYNKED